MDGETNIDTRKGTFGAASLWSKTKILFAGVTMNWILAAIILAVLSCTSGIPKAFEGQYFVENDTVVDTSSLQVYIVQVYEGTPAEKGGIKERDVIYEAIYKDETVKIETASDIQNFNSKHKNETVSYKVRHINEEEETLTIKLGGDKDEFVLGIGMSQLGVERYKTTWSAPVVAIVNTVQITGETFRGLGNLLVDIFSGVSSQFSSDEAVKAQGQQKIEAVGDSVAGPVGIIGVLFPSATQSGIANILFLAAIISISLACMNVLPIPALDGGRWFLIILFEKILRRKLTPEVESRIVSRAFIVLLIIAGLITILDVTKILR
jgi:regulator of sigma E protease